MNPQNIQELVGKTAMNLMSNPKLLKSLIVYQNQYEAKEITDDEFRDILNKLMKNGLNEKAAAQAAAQAAQKKQRSNYAEANARINALILQFKKERNERKERERQEELQRAQVVVSLQTPNATKILGENVNDTSINDRTKEALQRIRTIYNGAKCDSEGFYQHSGECWNDAIQMMFLFSDKLKEVVQKKLAMNTIDLNFIPYPERVVQKFKENLLRVEGVEPSKDFLLKSALLYFKSVQNRFVRHYITETSGRTLATLNEECPIKKPIEILHVKGRNAIRGAAFGIPTKGLLHAANYSKTEKGANLYDQLYVIELFITTFFTFTENDTIQSNVFYKSLDSASNIKELEVNNIVAIKLGTLDHALCFYTCGKQDFFYEDNYGPIKFPWRKTLNDVIYIKFGRLANNNNETLSSYHPIIETDGKYYTYYNDIYYEFPKSAFIDPNTYENMGENKIAYIPNNKLTTLIIPLLIDKSKNTQVISNTNFIFNRTKRLNSIEYYNKAKSERDAEQAKRDAEQAKRDAEWAAQLAKMQAEEAEGAEVAKKKRIEEEKIAAQKKIEYNGKTDIIESQIQMLNLRQNELMNSLDPLGKEINEVFELYIQASKETRNEYTEKLNILHKKRATIFSEYNNIDKQINELKKQLQQLNLTYRGGYTKTRTYKQKRSRRGRPTRHRR